MGAERGFALPYSRTIPAKTGGCGMFAPVRRGVGARRVPTGLHRRAVLSRPAGQHLAEYALLMGIVAVAVISLQHLVRNAVSSGPLHVSATVLGVPDEDAGSDTVKSLNVTSKQRATERGLGGGFRLVTESWEHVTGQSVNEDIRERIIPDPGRVE